MKNILYISALASENRINEEYKCTGKDPGFAVQKFSRLLVEGLRKKGAKTVALSNPPNTLKRGSIFFPVDENEYGVHYKYIPYINIPLLKHLCVLIYTFFYVLFWGLKQHKKKVIVCDVLAISVCLGALLASKINRVMSVAIVTDLYGLIAGKKGLLMNIAEELNNLYVSSFNKYVLLTEEMNDFVNPKHRPHIVMEALCDNKITDIQIENSIKSVPRIMLYAGGLHEKYGLKMLVDGFIIANVPDTKLVLYGSGPYVDELKKMAQKYPQIEYRGVASNDEVVTEELKATILVNPRFTTEPLTKYSFPSKNMEYMTTGTPLLTTKLSGMPEEYYSYVFLFEEESVNGYAAAIKRVFSYDNISMQKKGNAAREFVLLNKNNEIQANRILQLITEK